MGFMEQQITDKQDWYEVDGSAGIDYIPADVIGMPRHCSSLPIDREVTDDYPRLFAALCKAVRDYTSNTRIDTISLTQGYGARLSAPGYMDCTEWCVFGSEQEAADYLQDMYGEEEEEEEEEEDTEEEDNTAHTLAAGDTVVWTDTESAARATYTIEDIDEPDPRGDTSTYWIRVRRIEDTA